MIRTVSAVAGAEHVAHLWGSRLVPHMRLCSLLIILGVVLSAFASSGDRASEFTNCLINCSTTQCESDPNGIIQQPIALRLTRWTCTDDCKYECMHDITDRHIERGERIHQYYGKWPFWRLGGIQEPASVLFSLLNLWAHLDGGRKLRRRVSESHPMRRYYLQWSWCSVNAWVWSSVFHTRDQPITEKLDYFSAALAILYALYYTIIRLFHLYPSSNKLTSARPTTLKRYALGSICAIAFVCHVSYLLWLPRFDYTYNMAFNLLVGSTHNILWIIYSLPSRLSFIRRFPARAKSYRPSFTTKAAVLVFLTTCAIGLEVFDFPPWGRVVDAHALWHLATFPIAVLWYRFLIQDSRDHEGWGEKAHHMTPLASRIGMTTTQQPNTKTLDHIVHLTPPGSVEEASNQFRKLGFTVTPGGTHADGLTANALVLLADGVYLELISFTHPLSHYPPGSPPYLLRKNHRWADRVPGWIDFAFLGNGILNGEGQISKVINSRAEEEGSGASYKNEVEGGRVRAGDGKVLKWVISAPAAPEEGTKDGEEGQQSKGPVGVLPFFCGDVTPRDWRVPSHPPTNRDHPSGALGIAYIKLLTVNSTNPRHLEELTKKLTSVVGKPPSKTSGPTESIWELDTPARSDDADTFSKTLPTTLIAAVPQDDDEVAAVGSWGPSSLAGVYEVAFWVERVPSGVEVVKTPFGRIRWVEASKQ